MAKGKYIRTQEHRAISATSLAKVRYSRSQEGSKNPNWKGGIWQAKGRDALPRPDACEVCGILASELKKSLCFDHDHMTGKFRGWLCTRCNVALGMVRDNPNVLRALIDYLESKKT